MKVQNKISLLLLVIVMIFGGGLALIKTRERSKFLQIAHERKAERSRSFDEFMARRGEPLEMLAKDYTYMDDMVRAIATKDSAWADHFMDEANWERSNATVIWLYRPDRTLFQCINRPYAYGQLPEKEIPLPPAVFDALSREKFMHFFMPTSKGLMEVRAATVHPSTDSWRKTPEQGYFFVGQLWSEELMKTLSRDSGNQVRLTSTDVSGIVEADNVQDGTITLSRPLPGWDGKPIAWMLISNDSPTIKEFNRSSEQLLLLLVLFALALLLLLTTSLTRWVSRPLWLISQTLKTENLAPLDRLSQSKSEFGLLAKLIREFFDQRASLIAEINERKSAQEALRQSGEQLRQAQKMEAVGRLAGGIAHDFNNLLTAILGYAELLAVRRDLDPSSRQNVDAIRKAGRQAAAVTHQLLAFSRKQILQPRVIDLNALVVDFEKILRRVIGEHIELRTRPRAASGRVKADPNQLEQVILNLGVNARDAMPKGGRLTIRTSNVEFDEQSAPKVAPDFLPGRYVLLEVTDTGSGMDEEVKSRIFEPFFTTKGPGKGTGLGLATVYGIVKQSGGVIIVESAIGAGTTFRVYMPFEEGPLEEIKPKTVAPIALPERPVDTILVVEDEEIVRELVCHVLSAQGYQVLCASHGMEALRMSAEHQGNIQLVITDVIMPHMGGLELSHKLVAERPDIKVLYVSGYSESDISEQGVLEVDLEFLEKPFTPQTLTRKVREVLNPFVSAAAADSTVPHVSSSAS